MTFLGKLEDSGPCRDGVRLCGSRTRRALFPNVDNCFSLAHLFSGVDQLAARQLKTQRKNNYLIDIIARRRNKLNLVHVTNDLGIKCRFFFIVKIYDN